MNASIITYGATIAFALVNATGAIANNLLYARPHGYSKWKNQVVPHFLVLLACIALAFYPLTALPQYAAIAFNESVDEYLFLLAIMFFAWFFGSIGTFVMREIMASGKPASFIGQMILRIFKSSNKKGRENLRAMEYATMGICGMALLGAQAATFVGGSMDRRGLSALVCGLVSCLILWSARKICNVTDL